MDDDFTFIDTVRNELEILSVINKKNFYPLLVIIMGSKCVYVHEMKWMSFTEETNGISIY